MSKNCKAFFINEGKNTYCLTKVYKKDGEFCEIHKTNFKDQCFAILKTGNNKNGRCIKPSVSGGNYCGTHKLYEFSNLNSNEKEELEDDLIDVDEDQIIEKLSKNVESLKLRTSRAEVRLIFEDYLSNLTLEECEVLKSRKLESSYKPTLKFE